VCCKKEGNNKIITHKKRKLKMFCETTKYSFDVTLPVYRLSFNFPMFHLMEIPVGLII